MTCPRRPHVLLSVEVSFHCINILLQLWGRPFTGVSFLSLTVLLFHFIFQEASFFVISFWYCFQGHHFQGDNFRYGIGGGGLGVDVFTCRFGLFCLFRRC